MLSYVRDHEQLLAQVVASMLADPALGHHLSAPSVSHGTNNLYMRGALEAETAPNLEKVRGGAGCV